MTYEIYVKNNIYLITEVRKIFTLNFQRKVCVFNQFEDTELAKQSLWFVFRDLKHIPRTSFEDVMITRLYTTTKKLPSGYSLVASISNFDELDEFKKQMWPEEFI